MEDAILPGVAHDRGEAKVTVVGLPDVPGYAARVLRALADGQPITTLGRRLYIAESTVKTHLRRIYRKLGVASRGEAVERGRELFLLD